MEKISLNVQKEFCDSCALAFRRFVGKMNGVDSIEVNNGKLDISFDSSKIAEADLFKIIKDSMDKLGYKILD